MPSIMQRAVISMFMSEWLWWKIVPCVMSTYYRAWPRLEEAPPGPFTARYHPLIRVYGKSSKSVSLLIKNNHIIDIGTDVHGTFDDDARMQKLWTFHQSSFVAMLYDTHCPGIELCLTVWWYWEELDQSYLNKKSQNFWRNANPCFWVSECIRMHN